MKSPLFASLVLVAVFGPFAFAQAPRFERVFGPEVPTGPYKHPACIEELDNGDLYLVYYGGKGEYANDTSVFGARLKKGEKSWSAPVEIAHDPFRSLGNGVIWQGPDGKVWLFYVIRFGETWSDSRIQVKISTDGAKTWSDPSLLTLEAGMMVRNRPIVLSDGSYLLPVYRETGHDTEAVGADSVSTFLKYDPKARTWTRLGDIKSAKGNIQPAVAELEPGRLVAYCRRGGDYDPKTVGYIVTAESRDFGKTWTEGRNSEFPNPNAAVDFLKLKSGRLLLVYNNSMVDRTPLTLALSSDGGKSFPIRRDLATGKNSFAYPIAFQARDGSIHVVYTSDKRSVIHHVVLGEDWLLESK